MMDKKKKKLIIEIFFFIIVIISTIPVWKILEDNNIKTTNAMLAYSSNITVDKIKDYNYNLFPMTDEYAINNLENSTLRINNIGKNDITGELLLKVFKTSQLDISNFKVKIGDKIIDVENNYLSCDEEYCYYLLDTVEIKAKNNLDVDYLIWLDENATNISGSITYCFEVSEI